MIKRAKPQSMRISLPLLYKEKKSVELPPIFLDIIPLNSCAFRTKFLHQYNTIMMMWGSLNAIWMSCTCFSFPEKNWLDTHEKKWLKNLYVVLPMATCLPINRESQKYPSLQFLIFLLPSECSLQNSTLKWNVQFCCIISNTWPCHF